MPHQLRHFESLDEPVVSPSGAWTLRYDTDGRAAIRHHNGDGASHETGQPVFSLQHGPVEPASLGDKAQVTEIRGNRFLESDNGKRTVNRTAGSGALICKVTLGVGTELVNVVHPVEAQTLEQPETWLAWRFLDTNERDC